MASMTPFNLTLDAIGGSVIANNTRFQFSLQDVIDPKDPIIRIQLPVALTQVGKRYGSHQPLRRLHRIIHVQQFAECVHETLTPIPNHAPWPCWELVAV